MRVESCITGQNVYTIELLSIPSLPSGNVLGDFSVLGEDVTDGEFWNSCDINDMCDCAAEKTLTNRSGCGILELR